MIKDRDFKKLKHSYNGFNKYANGQRIEAGYYPDYVLFKGNEYIILECENSTSRKAFIGGLAKAAHFLRYEKAGILVFVMMPKENTKIESIQAQIHQYFNWIKKITNLEKVYIIEADKYYKDKKLLRIESSEFLKKSYLIK